MGEPSSNGTKTPFNFVAASYLIRVRPERARSLRDMKNYISTVPAASIFYHTFQSLELHHYTSFSSDFAQWIMAACNEAALAEKLAAIDLREYVSLEDLRHTLVETIEEHLRAFPESGDRPAFEPFHFCEAREITVPLNRQATNLHELAEGIRNMSQQTLHYYFINSRLRLHLETNDFSYWIKNTLGLPELAAKLNNLDFYTDTLPALRSHILERIRKAEAR